jgi:hypothetical protein
MYGSHRRHEAIKSVIVTLWWNWHSSIRLLRYIVTYCTRFLTFLVDNAQQKLNAFSCLPAHLCIIIPHRKKTLELQSEFEAGIWGMDKVVIVASHR